MPKYKTWYTEALEVAVRAGNDGIGRVANISKDMSTCGSLSAYCRPYCYMGSSYYKATENITKSHMRNTSIFRDIDKMNMWGVFVFDMASLIQERNLSLFRVNVNGDLICKQEIFAWMQIARVCPDTKFWIPTKRFHWLDPVTVMDIKCIPNLSVSLSLFFNMPESVFADAKRIGLPIAYTDTVNRFRYRVCTKPCETCHWCFDGRGSVFLPLHGIEAKSRKKKYDMENITNKESGV